jgi:hypothetical protein
MRRRALWGLVSVCAWRVRAGGLGSFTVAVAALQFAAERKPAPQLDPYAPPVR